MQVKLAISSSHSILTLGQPVSLLALYRQAHGRVASCVPTVKSVACLDQEKQGLILMFPALDVDTLPPGNQGSHTLAGTEAQGLTHTEAQMGVCTHRDLTKDTEVCNDTELW